MFVETEPWMAPPQLTWAEHRALRPEERGQYDLDRIRHNASFGPIRTPALEAIFSALRRQAEINLYAPPGARPGSVIDGSAGLGKSTILTHFGRTYQRDVARRFDPRTLGVDEFLPVVYVTLAAGTTVKGLNELIADFYGLPFTTRSTKVNLTLQIQRAAARCATTLFLIDDIHYLKLNNQSDREVNDHLKHLASTIPATFVYAGINCDRGGLLREGGSPKDTAFSQTGSRFTLLSVDPFSITDANSAREWLSLLKAIEQQLRLLNAEDGMLTRQLREYLFERTHGEIGALMSLIRQGAHSAIETGEERLTAQLLDSIQLSHDAETESRRRGTRRRPARQDEAAVGGRA